MTTANIQTLYLSALNSAVDTGENNIEALYGLAIGEATIISKGLASVMEGMKRKVKADLKTIRDNYDR